MPDLGALARYDINSPSALPRSMAHETTGNEQLSPCSPFEEFTTVRDLYVTSISVKKANPTGKRHMYFIAGVYGQQSLLDSLRVAVRKVKYQFALFSFVIDLSATLKRIETPTSHSVDYIIHFVSNPLAAIAELAASSSWTQIDSVLPQPFAPANQTALQHALVHWVAINSLLETVADDRIRVEDLTNESLSGRANVLLSLHAQDREGVVLSQLPTTLTWDVLYTEDARVAIIACATARRYGYPCPL